MILDEFGNPISKEKKKSKIQFSRIVTVLKTIGVIGIIGLTADLIGLISFFSPPQKKTIVQQDEQVITAEKISFTENPAVFKILILPLSPDKDCTIEKSEYEKLLKNRYDELSKEENILIETKINLDIIDCPQSHVDAQDIGRETNADIIIWGQYDEECEGETKVRIRHTLLSNLKTSTTIKKGDSGYKILKSIQDISSKELALETDKIAFQTLGIYHFKEKQYRKAIRYLRKLESNCNLEISSMILFCYHKLRDSERFKKEMIDFGECLKVEFDKMSQAKQEVQNNPSLAKEYLLDFFVFHKGIKSFFEILEEDKQFKIMLAGKEFDFLRRFKDLSPLINKENLNNSERINTGYNKVQNGK